MAEKKSIVYELGKYSNQLSLHDYQLMYDLVESENGYLDCFSTVYPIIKQLKVENSKNLSCVIGYDSGPSITQSAIAEVKECISNSIKKIELVPNVYLINNGLINEAIQQIISVYAVCLKAKAKFSLLINPIIYNTHQLYILLGELTNTGVSRIVLNTEHCLVDIVDCLITLNQLLVLKYDVIYGINNINKAKFEELQTLKIAGFRFYNTVVYDKMLFGV